MTKIQSVFDSIIWVKIISTGIIFVTILSLCYISLMNISNSDKYAFASEIPTRIPSNPLSTFDPATLCASNNIYCESTPRNLIKGGVLNNKPAPTNKVYSSSLFNGQLDGLHLFPNIVRSDGTTGINVGFGERYEGSNWVSHTLTNRFINVKGASNASKSVIKNYSSITSNYSFVDEGNNSQFDATFVQGSPYIFFNPTTNKLTFTGTGFDIINQDNRLIFKQNNSNNYYGLFTSGVVTRTNNTVDIDFSRSPIKYATLGYFNDLSLYSSIEKHAGNIITSVDIEMLKTNDTFGTQYKFNYTRTSPSNTSIFGLLPHQWNKEIYPINPIFQTKTLRGDQRFIEFAGNFIFTLEKEAIFEDIPLDLLSQTDKNSLIALVRSDMTKLNPYSGGSYYGGKNMSKSARLAEIADSLGMTQERDQILENLKTEMLKWFTINNSENNWRNLKYNSDIGSIFSSPQEFGSETEINDHHFHYGMYIYAASVASKYDNDFRNTVSPVINVLIRDIASSNREEQYFPYMRVFDFFEGHSWASGTGLNRDGNNQESTSESIFAWYAIWRWGRVTNNRHLSDFGHYLYTNEVNSTNHYWLGRLNENGENNTPFKYFSNYSYKTASLVFGGSYKFDTWFSNDPLAIKGIQYLPFTAGATYLKDDFNVNSEWERVKTYSNIETRISGWADLNLMYYGMAKGKNVRSNLSSNFSQIAIDNGNTQSNFLSWIYFWDKISNYEKSGTDNYSLAKFTSSGQNYLLLDCNFDNAYANCKKGTQIVKESDLVFPSNPNSVAKDNFYINKLPDLNTATLEQIDQIISQNLECDISNTKNAKYYSCYITIENDLKSAISGGQFRLKTNVNSIGGRECNVRKSFILCLFMDGDTQNTGFEFEYKLGQNNWRKVYKQL